MAQAPGGVVEQWLSRESVGAVPGERRSHLPALGRRNVSSGRRPASRADSLGGSRPLKERDATSGSRTTAGEECSGKVGMARRGDEGEEFAEFLVGLERIASQLVG
jgi:hypothetical protein